MQNTVYFMSTLRLGITTMKAIVPGLLFNGRVVIFLSHNLVNYKTELPVIQQAFSLCPAIAPHKKCTSTYSGTI